MRPELMHLTLAFIGEAPDPGPAERAVRAAAAGVDAFTAALSRGGAFPTETRPRVLWIGLADGALELRAAAERLRAALRAEAVGFDDAAPVAHVTVARLREDAAPDERRAVAAAFAAFRDAVPRLAFPIGEMTLFRSTLGRSGPTYEPLVRAPLRRPTEPVSSAAGR